MTRGGRYADREEAGRTVAGSLTAFAGRDDVVVLALPRGGVEVGAVVARALGAPLDVLVVRKLGVPRQPELAMGAIAGDVTLVNEEVAGLAGVSREEIDRVAAAERAEMARRERAYRGETPPADVRDRTVVLVDDGLATGSTMRAAVAAIRERGPARVVVAVPVAPPEAIDRLGEEADEVVCPLRPAPFLAIGAWYDDFRQLSDDDVRRLLAAAGARAPHPAAEGRTP